LKLIHNAKYLRFIPANCSKISQFFELSVGTFKVIWIAEIVFRIKDVIKFELT